MAVITPLQVFIQEMLLWSDRAHSVKVRSLDIITDLNHICNIISKKRVPESEKLVNTGKYAIICLRQTVCRDGGMA